MRDMLKFVVAPVNELKLKKNDLVIYLVFLCTVNAFQLDPATHGHFIRVW